MYQSLLINNKKIRFFVPNQITKWRVDTFFSKEPDTLKWIRNFSYKDQIIFWDIGSNVGLYSIYAALFHDNILVTSFEPSTSNLRILSRNISINNLNDKILISQFPLNDQKNSFLEMNESEFIEGWSMNSFGQKSDFEGNIFHPKQNYKVYGTSIDYLIETNIAKVPNFIKIDVDGLEHKILMGGKALLKNTKLRSLLVEINEGYKEQFDNIIEIMKTNNFVIEEKVKADIANEKKFQNLYNYIFVRNEN